MSGLLDLINGSIDSKALGQLGQQLGASPQQAGSAVQAALPVLLGALHQNASSPGGASALSSALDRNHDGSVLDDVAGFFGQAATGSDVRSLDHIFGGRRAHVESAISQATGLDGTQITQLLAQLAPLVLGALARARTSSSAAGASASGGGLGDLLGSAMGNLHASNSGLGGLLGSLLGGGGAAGDSGGLGGLLGGLLGGNKG